MIATLINGKTYAEIVYQDLAKRVEYLRTGHSTMPGLAMIQVGNNVASQIYVRRKHKKAQEIGIHSLVYFLPEGVNKYELTTLIERLNSNKKIHGILVQLPLPSCIDTQFIIDSIDPAKDVDGLHSLNTGYLLTQHSGFIPCTPLGCLKLLQHQHQNMSGLRAIIVGRSNIVGKPLAYLLSQENCTVTIAHSQTRNLSMECREADVLIVAVGQPEMIRGSWIKPKATVIDVGINHTHLVSGRSRLVGDVCFDEAIAVAGAITPVPGGVGPVTIAMLLCNTLLAYHRQVYVSDQWISKLC